ncbi:MAG: aldo/keto reductase [Bacillaceae bacterium]|nr:aldo/keto reductase [Bacillaceae bacterium]
MPWFGLGVYKMREENETVEAIKVAIEHGYRSIDTAAIYQNEALVGKAIKECGVPREELFITSKVWNSEQGYETTLAAFEETMTKLDLEYLDLYLIHWPVPAQAKYKETWKALEKLYKDGRIRAIGVSNFQVHHLKDLIAECEVVPMVNQVEYHPKLTQLELHDFCKENKIQLEAWSPLMQGKLLDDPTLVEIAKKYHKSVAQIVLRWDIQNEVVTIPKSVTPHRIKENASIFDFELSQDDMEQINRLNEDARVGPNPDEFN